MCYCCCCCCWLTRKLTSLQLLCLFYAFVYIYIYMHVHIYVCECNVLLCGFSETEKSLPLLPLLWKKLRKSWKKMKFGPETLKQHSQELKVNSWLPPRLLDCVGIAAYNFSLLHYGLLTILITLSISSVYTCHNWRTLLLYSIMCVFVFMSAFALIFSHSISYLIWLCASNHYNRGQRLVKWPFFTQFSIETTKISCIEKLILKKSQCEIKKISLL